MIQTTVDRIPETLRAESGEFTEIHREVVGGVEVLYVAVKDDYEPVTPEGLAERSMIQQSILDIEMGLRSDNHVIREGAMRSGQDFLGKSPVTITEWKNHMTTAMALYPLQRPLESTMLDGTPVDYFAQKLFLHGQDAIGIRSRGSIFKNLLLNRRPVKSVTSLACGAAVPECDAIGEMTYTPEEILFVDYDEKALGYVDRIAALSGIDKNSYKKSQLDLIKGFILSDAPSKELKPEGSEIVDALGITEYFRGNTLKKFLEKAYGLVAPGGSLIFGNMLNTHPALQFNKQVVGWPGVQERSVEELVESIKHFTNPANARIYIPEDMIYGVVEITKPFEDNGFKRGVGQSALVNGSRHLRPA